MVALGLSPRRSPPPTVRTVSEHDLDLSACVNPALLWRRGTARGKACTIEADPILALSKRDLTFTRLISNLSARLQPNTVKIWAFRGNDDTNARRVSPYVFVLLVAF